MRRLRVEPCELMKRCWLVDKQRPTMKDIVKIVEGWDPSTWEMDVLTSADCTMESWCVCWKQRASIHKLLYGLRVVAVAQLFLLALAKVIVDDASTQRAPLDHAHAVPAH